MLSPSVKKAILAVDLEAGVAGALAAGLREWQSEIRLRQVSLAHAAEALQREVFDLVVVDRSDPGAAPAALVAALAAAAPATRLLLVGEAGSADRPLLQGLGNVEEMPGPATAAGLVARIVAALQRGVKGHLENVGLAALVQLLALDKESCTLTVQSAMGAGTLYFVRGELVDAETVVAAGEEAAIEVLGWEVADVEMTGSALHTRRAIEMPVTFLLIEAMRRRDERARGQPGSETEGAMMVVAQGGSNGAGALPARDGLVPALSRDVEGLVAAAVVELASGAVLETISTRDEFDLHRAAAHCCELLRQEMGLPAALELRSPLDDVVLTFGDEIHLLKLGPAGHFLYVVADRARTNLAAVRSSLQPHWQAFSGPASGGRERAHAVEAPARSAAKS